MDSKPVKCRVMSAAIRAYRAQEDYWKYKIQVEERRVPDGTVMKMDPDYWRYKIQVEESRG